MIYVNFVFFGLGMVKAIGKELFQCSTDMEVLSITQQIIDGGQLQEHVVFKVFLGENATSDRKQIERKPSSAPKPLQMSVDCFCSAFPYHVIFDDNLQIVHSGAMIQQLCPAVQRPNSRMNDCFILLRPKMTLTLENINTFINANFMLEVKVEQKNGLTTVTHSKIVLKGNLCR